MDGERIDQKIVEVGNRAAREEQKVSDIWTHLPD